MADPKALRGLVPQAYEHPLDRRALDALQGTRGLEALVRKCNEWGFERLLRVHLMGSHLQVTSDSFPQLDEMLRLACERLDLPTRPALYVGGSGELNAMTVGVEHPIVVVSSAAIDELSDDELLFVLGHELGHIKSGHGLYYQIAEFLPLICEAVGDATLGVGALLGVGLQAALLSWRRKSEFTSDRAGLLVVQDLHVALGALMKLAGLPRKYADRINVDDFILQARAFEDLDSDKLSWFAKWLSTPGQSHPWTVLRAKECLAWVDDGGYQSTLEAPQRAALVLPAGVKKFCVKCGNGLSGEERFCTGCGHAVPDDGCVRRG